MLEFDSYGYAKVNPAPGSVVRTLLKRTFPDYKGRKLKVQTVRTYGLYDNYWSGGSKGTYVLVNLDTLTTLPIGNNEAPWTALADDKMKPREIPPNALIIKHTIFCGRDLGITFIIAPDTLATFEAMLTASKMPALV